ncbi:hypothetical protein YTPLAS18_09370 [Nitrospira sp.]|nr:hypothetical protein YTPLAS18_09370 [Nitrospira sp.]
MLGGERWSLRWSLFGLVVLQFLSLVSCASSVGMSPDDSGGPNTGESLVAARVITVLLERPGRMYDPSLIFFELQHEATGERFRVDVENADKVVVFQVPPGSYQVTRVQIGEGPFRSMANLALEFQVEGGRPVYLGTWRIGVESPRSDRKVLISTVNGSPEQDKDLGVVMTEYPEVTAQDFRVAALTPPETEARLYEVMPYPRYQPYFRRHW